MGAKVSKRHQQQNIILGDLHEALLKDNLEAFKRWLDLHYKTGMTVTDYNWSWAHLAAWYNSKKVLDYLLAINHDSIEHQDNACELPLHIASACGHSGVTQTILKHRPDHKICKNSYNQNPVDIALAKDHLGLLLQFDAIDVATARLSQTRFNTENAETEHCEISDLDIKS